MKCLAIIPARSGSKGLPDKNIKNLNGKPLMYYTIKAALDSKCFEEVMVSTDSNRYAEIARECGAKVPFLRSEATAGDGAGTWDTVREVLNEYRKLGKEFDYVTVLQPTSPLRDDVDIVHAFEQLREGYVNNVVSIVSVEHPVQWCFRLPENGMLDEFAQSPYNNVRRQDLEKHYRENGAIYIVDAKKIMDDNYNFYADKCFGYIMRPDKSVDIDTELDFMIAEEVYANILKWD